MPVRYAVGRSLQTAVIAACMQLLQRMHAAGWVHGDTHLGNFMLDSDRWRVLAIDVERSFRSDCPRQHLIDMQELFGHASGLLVAQPCTNQWDMRDVLGVLVLLHPAVTQQKTAAARSSRKCSSKRHKIQSANDEDDVLRLLPVCICFASDSEQERLDGCQKCNTPFFKDASAHYALNPRAYIDSLLLHSLEKVAKKVAEARAVAHSRLRAVADPLRLDLMKTPCAAALLRLRHDEAPDDTTPSTDDAQFDDWVANLLFLGVILPSDDAECLIGALLALPCPEMAGLLRQGVLPRLGF